MHAKTFTLEEWLKVYKKESNDIIESLIWSVNSFHSENKLCYINVPGLRDSLARIAYSSSKNRYKGFMLGF